ncbi:MAG: UDP-N-acetylglucosamine--N-acetylmuramyl-(pentapeptide) pyrophosphoryl-undecaprenol N-acetylglucosamine transferase [Chloroflexota bacterium]|nr:MAG: UDP-N-acetylglucosamine--N-acetylmuramyl-(pentapeptide) pyrophosphoryl-undecaprenol N-acetylglucosamine transferase [Chloroflexota bacterium]
MRLIISGGGTGGHVYPALAVVPKLRQQCAELDLLWIGSSGGMEQALVERAGLTFEAIAALGLRGKNPFAAAQGLWALSQGYRQSRQIMRRFRPDVLFVTGGYVCVPVTLAARQAGVPVIIYLPDIEPGLAIKFLARFAAKVAVTAPEAQQFFKPGLTVVTGYPVRDDLFSPSFQGGGWGEVKAAARRQLGLRDDLPVLMIFGGSRGARSINQAVAKDIESYLQICQVVHVTGTLDEAWVLARRAELSPELQTRYRVSAYLHDEMVTALLAADLVISRAGASVLGEFPAAELPAILVPYLYAGAHQNRNAEYLARHQAAVVIKDAELSQRLKETVIETITDQDKLRAMSRASARLAQPEAATRLAQVIVEVRDRGN